MGQKSTVESHTRNKYWERFARDVLSSAAALRKGGRLLSWACFTLSLMPITPVVHLLLGGQTERAQSREEAFFQRKTIRTEDVPLTLCQLPPKNGGGMQTKTAERVDTCDCRFETCPDRAICKRIPFRKSTCEQRPLRNQRNFAVKTRKKLTTSN